MIDSDISFDFGWFDAGVFSRKQTSKSVYAIFRAHTI